MAASGGVIYEDVLFKLTGGKGKSFWNKSNPWKERYFIIKTEGNRPVLEYYAKKPKNKNVTPKDRIRLSGGFRVEKVTNTRNRAYVFEITTEDKYLCLSADEQRRMDMFVFVLQAQIRLKEQIIEDYSCVQAEHSEAQRRIGAKGTNCILQICPWGLTLAIQSCRSVLAQWPLKSVRYFEASGNGKFMLEAGRIAPMGDGIYVFETTPGDDNKLYDLLDQYIINALGKIQPGRRGTTEEMEDYVLEAERLSALTTVCLFTPDNPIMPVTFMENWGVELSTHASKQVVHTRQNSLSSSNSDASVSVPPPLPNRINTKRGTTTSPRLVRSPASSVPSTAKNSSVQSKTSTPGTPLRERPPLPPPTNHSGSARSSTKPIGIPRNLSDDNILSNDNYFRMNSTSSTGSKFQSPTTQSGMWSPPPSFQDVVGEFSFPKDGTMSGRDGYLTPRASAEMAAQGNTDTTDYILPSSPTEDREFNSLTRPTNSKNNKHKRSPRHRASSSLNKAKSASCEEMTEYLRGFSMTESRPRDVKKDENENVQTYDLAKPIAPFPKLQDFHGSLELLADHPKHSSTDYYNIEGLKGEIDTSNNPRVSVVRRKFNDMCRENLTRSVSNPNFLQIQSKEKLTNVRSSAIKSGSLTRDTHAEHKQKSKSLLNLFRSKTNRSNSDSGMKVVSTSTPSSPTGTLTRQTSTSNIVINVPGIYVTQRTRSFRRPRPKTDNSDNSPRLPTKRKDKSVSPAIKRVTHSLTDSALIVKHSREGSNSSTSSATVRERRGSENAPVQYSRQDSGTITLPVRHSREGSGSSSRQGGSTNLSPRHSGEVGVSNGSRPHHGREGSGSGPGSALINLLSQSPVLSSKSHTNC